MDLNYGVDISTRTQLIDGLDSQRVFFNDDKMLNELAADISPLMVLLMNLPRKKAAGTTEAYTEHRGSYLSDVDYFVQASATTAISALSPNAATYTGLKFAATQTGTAVAHGMQVNDVFVFIDLNDPTKYASGIVMVLTSTTEVTWKLLTASPGFDLSVTSGSRTIVRKYGQNFAEGSAKSQGSKEVPTTWWNEVGSFKHSFEITDQLLATGDIRYGDELLFQNREAQKVIMKQVDRMLLFASRRTNLATAANPFSAIGSTPVLDPDGKIQHMSISLDQAIRAANAGGLASSRVFRHAAATMTPGEFERNLIEQYRWGGKNKKWIVGPYAMQDLVDMTRKVSSYQLTGEDTSFGVTWTKYRTPTRMLDLAVHDGLIGTPFERAMFCLDTEYLSLRQLIPLYTQKQPTTTTSKEWELRWDIGLRVKFPEAHGLWLFS